MSALASAAVDSQAQEHLWSALSAPVDLLLLREALASGADPNARHSHSQLAPVEAAVDAGSQSACRLLVEHGARINVRAVEDGRGLLHRAIAALSQEDRHPLVEYLLEAGVDPEAVTDQGQSALEWARMWADDDLIRRLRTDLPPEDLDTE